jgi:hypothetical protein
MTDGHFRIRADQKFLQFPMPDHPIFSPWADPPSCALMNTLVSEDEGFTVPEMTKIETCSVTARVYRSTKPGIPPKDLQSSEVTPFTFRASANS